MELPIDTNKKGQRHKSLATLYIERFCCINIILQNSAKNKKKRSTKCEVEIWETRIYVYVVGDLFRREARYASSVKL